MEYLKLTLTLTMEQLLVVVVPVVLIAFLMNFVAKHAWKYGGRLVGRTGFALFTAPGTMIHELSHAAACLVFRHEIVEMALFKPDPVDGSLGYVKHSYDRNSFYQRMGNLPIGVAPIIGGGVALAVVLVFLGQIGALKSVVREPNPNLGAVQVLVQGMSAAWDAMVVMVKTSRVFSLGTVVFLYLTFCIGTNISLSKADMRGVLPVIPVVIGMLYLVNVVFGWIPAYVNGVAWVIALGAACLGLLVIVLAVNTLLLAVMWGVAKLLGRTE